MPSSHLSFSALTLRETQGLQTVRIPNHKTLFIQQLRRIFNVSAESEAIQARGG